MLVRLATKNPTMPSDTDVRTFSRSIALLILTVHTLASTAATESVTLTAHFRPGRPLHRFIPSHALGAAIDADSGGTQNRKLTPANIQSMLSAGLKSLAYRLRTELAIHA